MTITSPSTTQNPGSLPPAEVVAGPWPTYTNGRHLPERDRWQIYESAKATRRALEDRGVVMSESYGAFVARVCMELDI
ncbi:hypothetical protein N5D61_05310 [Pseudomonas sp. GD03842]|uniref:hypothetical protein n=1 Tax=Pseudomonas sp. GD03842 TaxID=2975385 RepID=UPI00244AA269|nr:hypothetical protein [Pseudomonas sp. GD03842]MDH0745757.1 hypothetical protein [Pseudomonas sp. GD03842]